MVERHLPAFSKSSLLTMKRYLLLLFAVGTLVGHAMAAKPVRGIPGPIEPGVYEMVKLSGSSLISLGDLEIRGSTCQALGQGGFKPFTIDASGNITWGAGLAILPDGWKIRRSVYTKDSKGKPLIQIYYTSSSGTDDSLDAYLKK